MKNDQAKKQYIFDISSLWALFLACLLSEIYLISSLPATSTRVFQRAALRLLSFCRAVASVAMRLTRFVERQAVDGTWLEMFARE